ncbi:MAG: WG repeat-containing protein [Bacteroidetes bacterium]|nr:WG repeat-containing protein [Bacteroidota bacterium]
MKRFLLVAICVQFSGFLCAGKLERGFAALKIYNYFKARELFLGSMKRHPAGASFGLAEICSRTDNPFHDPMRAYNYVQEAKFSLPLTKKNERSRLARLGITDSSLRVLEQRIDSLCFRQAQKINTLAAYNLFIENNCDSQLVAAATESRNALAFSQTVGIHTWQAYLAFMSDYPQAAQVPVAAARYHELLFLSSTEAGTPEVFENFLRSYPESPYRLQAEDSLYSLSVPEHTVAQYYAFVQKHPANRNVPDAWKRIYRLSVNDFTTASISRFKNQFPDYPFPEQLTADIELAQTPFFPVQVKDSAGNVYTGFADSTGKVRIAPQFSRTEFFYEGLAVAANDKFSGYIAKNGTVVIPLQYLEAGNFNNGTAVVIDSLDQYYLIDHTGKTITRRAYDFIGPFSEGLARVSRNDCSGFIDITGNELIECRPAEFGNFSQGLAWMRDSTGRWGFINRKGETVIPPLYDRAESFAAGLPVRVRLNNRWGLINAQGQLLQPCIYTYIGPWSEGLALVVLDGKFGYLNAAGKIAVPISFLYNREELGDNLFRNNSARVLLEKKAGLIDSTGKLILPRDFDDVQPFQDGFAAVNKKGKWGYADRLQKLRIPYTFDEAGPFVSGLALVRINGRLGMIDTKGNYVLPPSLEEAQRLPSGYILVADSTRRKGLLDSTGAWVLPCLYSQIEQVDNSPVFSVSCSAESYGYFDAWRCEMFWLCEP